jgi:hypothetical protein
VILPRATLLLLPWFSGAAGYRDNACAGSKTLVILSAAKDLFSAIG